LISRSSATVQEVEPTIATDGHGGVAAAWIGYLADGTLQVFAAVSRDNGATFGAPQQVMLPPGLQGGDPAGGRAGR
jgi:hypothetical protein